MDPELSSVTTGNWTLPNALTVLRIFLVPILVVFLLTDYRLVGLSVFIIASLTDWFDGYLARTRKQITTLGQLLDPIADKLLVSAAFISLVELGLAPAWMVVIIIGRELAISGLRPIAASHGIIISSSALGKYKTTVQMVTVVLLLLGPAYLGEYFMTGEISLGRSACGWSSLCRWYPLLSISLISGNSSGRLANHPDAASGSSPKIPACGSPNYLAGFRDCLAICSCSSSGADVCDTTCASHW